MAFARVTIWVPILGVLLLSGCAVTPETAHLEPHLKVQPDNFWTRSSGHSPGTGFT
jgi:hypothetical protein